MSTITTRAGKGSPLTNNEVDANFTNLNTDKAELSGAAFTGAITTTSTIDGRDVATDGSKLDGIEASADVTDTTNVTAAGALMDSEVTNLAQVKAFDSADYATAAQGTTADAALPRTGGAMTGAITTNSTFDGRDVATDGSKLDGIEAGADVTDTANVTAAGALMDSELTSEASVKALNQGVATTDSPTFAGLTSSGEITANGGIALGDGDELTLGDSDEFKIKHHASGYTHLQNTVGTLYIDSDSVTFRDDDGSPSNMVISQTGIDVTGNISNASGDLTLDVAGNIKLDADSSNIYLADGGTDIGLLSTNNQDLNIRNLITDKDIYFQGNDGGSTITALTLDMSQSGQATFGGNLVVNGPDVTITGGIIHAGDTNTYFGFHDADQWRVVTGGTERIEVTNTEIVINDSSVDMDFRVESNGNANMLFVDGGNDRVMLGGNAQDGAGTLAFNSGSGAIRHVHPAGTAKDNLLFAISGTNNGFQTTIDSSNNITYKFHTGGNAEAVRFDTTESVFNEGSVDRDFRVESEANANMLLVDGGSEQVKIGASSMATYGNLEVQNSDGRHGIGQKSWSAISGTSHPSRSVDGVMAFNTASAGNQLSIPIVSQANQHRPALIELTFLSGEYNTSGSVKAGFVRLAFQSLNSIGSVAEIDKSGNVASVSSSGMNILINFTSAYTAGQSNYEGVMCYYRVMHEQPQYVKMWDATLN